MDIVQNSTESTLEEKLNKIRSSPKLQNQQQNAIVLHAIEDTLGEQKSDYSPTAYFAALLSLLNQHIASSRKISNKEVSTAVVYLLDLVTPEVPAPLLRSKFGAILKTLGPCITLDGVEAPFVRACIGCIVSLLLAQDAQAWALPQSQIGPRQALAGVLSLAVDHRPKIRKKAQEGVAKVLENPPPSPSADHPAADLCAETSLRHFESLVGSSKTKTAADGRDPSLVHAVQLIKTIATACGGWPGKSINALSEVLLSAAKLRGEFLTTAIFDVFEAVMGNLGSNNYSTRLEHLVDILSQLEPSPTDEQLIPPWLGVLSRGYDVSSQLSPDETFQKLPEILNRVSRYLASSSYNICVSTSEFIISLFVNCVPTSVLLHPSFYDERILDKLATSVQSFLNVKYQASWMEVFQIISSALEALQWQASPRLHRAVSVIGELRTNESFSGRQQADGVLSKAIAVMGPKTVVGFLPLNLLSGSSTEPGRAWLLPLMRDSVRNTELAHFRAEFIPLSEVLFQKVLNHGTADKTIEIKVFETLIHQIWTILPGYCDRPRDLISAFDRGFAELLAKLLYQQPDLRTTICKALQTLVDSNKTIAALETEHNLILQGRISKADATRNINHLSQFTANLLAVMFNIYSETTPQHRAPILDCIDAYVGIISLQELAETFNRVLTMLESKLRESSTAESIGKELQKHGGKSPISHSLMDIVVTMSVYLPRESYEALFTLASLIISHRSDVQLQKKAYKLIPRLSLADNGRQALEERNTELRSMLLANYANVLSPARRDRLNTLAVIIDFLPQTELHFIPSILPEVISCTKDSNEKARDAAFDLIIRMGEKLQEGGIIDNSKIENMPPGSPKIQASIEEYFTMLSAGLAGTTPNMISATVVAISRALFHFRSSLSEHVMSDLINTMDIFLKSPTREVVRSVLGFVKVCVIWLPIDLMRPRLPDLVPSLMPWSHEHRGHFKTKVRNILERTIRRFGVEDVQKYCPEADKKLIANIRKIRDRQKRKKSAAADEDSEDEGKPQNRRKLNYSNEFDDAMYGSNDDSAESGSDGDDEDNAQAHGRPRGPQAYKKKNKPSTFILEDEDEPLDLLDRKALGNISSTKPMGKRGLPAKGKAGKTKTDVDGKLILREPKVDGDAMEVDDDLGDGSLEGGINAYVDAIRGRDAPSRGQRGRLKFSNKPRRGEDDKMGEDDDDVPDTKQRPRGGFSKSRSSFRERGRGLGGRGAGRAAMSQRRGLGVEKKRGPFRNSKLQRSGNG